MYRVSAELYLRALGLVYVAAFVSFGVQVEGLIGDEGVRPASLTLALVARQLPGGLSGWLQFPTLGWWIGGTDVALHATWIGGAACGALLMLGVAPLFTALAALISYLSLVVLGREFMAYQWDNLLLEAGLVALVLAPLRLAPRRALARPPLFAAIALNHLLVVRLVVSSGISKLASGDLEWSELRALRYHFETQPLPTWIGWWAHQLPDGMLALATALTFVAQLVLPLLAFFPGRARWVAAGAIGGHQLIIALTGNYGFFNLLAVALVIPLLDDDVWRRLAPWRPLAGDRPSAGVPATPAASASATTPSRARPWICAPLIAAYAIASALTLATTLRLEGSPSPSARAFMGALRPFRVVNGYGLFAWMTRTRDELTLEGSLDGVSWRPYVFRYKPGPLDRAPAFVAPHMPRLDWQMWFAALGPPEQSPWLVPFLERLRAGSPSVMALFEHDPFAADGPPAKLRLRSSRYLMTDPDERAATGRWWRTTEPRAFLADP